MVPADDGDGDPITQYTGTQDLEVKDHEVKRKHTRTDQDAP